MPHSEARTVLKTSFWRPGIPHSENPNTLTLRQGKLGSIHLILEAGIHVLRSKTHLMRARQGAKKTPKELGPYLFGQIATTVRSKERSGGSGTLRIDWENPPAVERCSKSSYQDDDGRMQGGKQQWPHTHSQVPNSEQPLEGHLDYWRFWPPDLQTCFRTTRHIPIKCIDQQ